MTTFTSDQPSLKKLLDEIVEGKIQLPDFQRGWVWDDERIKDLLVSIARSFPVGAVMLLETGGEVQFQMRPVEGVDLPAEVKPELLILDGQQRLTTLTQAIALSTAVDTRTIKGKPIKRHYYFDINKALEGPEYIEEAIVSVNENKRILTNFDRDVVLDLSTPELECRQMYFPCDQILNSDKWEEALQEYAPEHFLQYMAFRKAIINSFRQYNIPTIKLGKESTKEAVCLVFEKVNTGGVQLSVFELVTAGFAAENYNLRDDWFGSERRNVSSREKRLAEDPLLEDIKATEFLQAITLLTTYQRKQGDIKAGKEGKRIRPVSAKRASVLALELGDYTYWADKLETGFQQAAYFLRLQGLYNQKEQPYGTQVVPLAAILTVLGERWREPKILEKLAQWYWCGALGELYGGAVETRMANDLDEVLHWIDNETSLPRTVTEANFQIDRLYSLRSRLSAAYKAINTLILREGAQDFFWKMGVKELSEQGIDLDIHHIFPRKWCEEKGIDLKAYDHVLNKTPISYKANRKIGGSAPALYLRQLQQDTQVGLDDEGMHQILSTHAINPELLRADDFEAFIKDREAKIMCLINNAMGK